MFLWRHKFRRKGGHIWILAHSLQFPGEITRILKVPIDTRKPNVRHLIKFTEIVHHLLANVSTLDFGLKPLVDVMFDLGDQRRDLFIADLSFPASTLNSLLESLPVVGNARAVPLDHPDMSRLNSFVCRELSPTGATLTPPPHDRPICAGTRIGNLVIVLLTKGTKHSHKEQKLGGR